MYRMMKIPNYLFNIAILLLFLIEDSNGIYQFTHFDSQGYIALILLILFLIVFSKKLRVGYTLHNNAVIAWGLLIVFHTANAFFRGIEENMMDLMVPQRGLKECIFMIVIPILYLSDKEKLLKSIIGIFYIGLLINYLFGEVSDNAGRMSGVIFTTHLGHLAGMTCFVVSLYIYIKHNLKLCWLFVFPIFMMILAGSRNGLGVTLMAFICLALPYIQRHKWTVLFFIALGFVFNYYLQDTVLLSRIEDDGGYDIPIETGTILDKLLGDRLFYYVYGYYCFKENPILGIGVFNFADYTRYIHPLHSEPMTHLAEGGLIGITIYLRFKYYFVKMFSKYCSFSSYETNQYLILFVCLAWLGLTARIYQIPSFFIMYGLIVGHLLECEIQTNNISYNEENSNNS